MSSSTIESLNKILTNTFLYVDRLTTISQKAYSEETRMKLRDFVDRRKRQANELVHAISSLGGDVQSTPRRTDGASVFWCPEILPQDSETIPLLKYLISSEEKSLDDYEKAINQISNTEIETQLKDHMQQGEATLKYLRTALQTNQASIDK